MKNKYLLILLIAFSLSFNLFAYTGDGDETGLKNNYWKKFHQELKITKENRLNVESPWFFVNDADIGLYSTYNGWDILKSKRIRHRKISTKAIQMIKKAKKIIVASVFLYDCMYADITPEFDVVKVFRDLLIKKKKENPEIKIIIILDPLNRAYGRKVSESVQIFLKNGIDVFYSDLLPSKSATKLYFPEALSHLGRALSEMTLGFVGSLADLLMSVPITKVNKTLETPVSIEIVKEAWLLKANHRKILVTDIDGGKEFEALVASANPHNASDDSNNHTLTVKGDMAKYIYSILREDVVRNVLKHRKRIFRIGWKNSFALFSDQSKKKYKMNRFRPGVARRYLKEHMPPVDLKMLNTRENETDIKTKFVTEKKIKVAILKLLDNVKPSDKVRIQMFYLSDFEIIDAIIKIANHTNRSINNPIQLLLDPNKDAFNSIKDGTPNRQAAYTMLSGQQKTKLKVRWYSTHGEQNHAKIMTITNDDTKKYEITTGSCNWTGKNMKNINMESNMIIVGSKRLNDQFNRFFDMAWGNLVKGIEYSLPYKAYDLSATYRMTTGKKIVDKWRKKCPTKVVEWLNQNSDRVEQRMLLENPYITPDLHPSTVTDWLNLKMKRDKGGLERIMLTFVGSDHITPNETVFEKWSRKYMKKWINGEVWGLVSW